MNKEELVSIDKESEDDVVHYGTPRHSGRYPWGSGDNPQHNQDFLSRYYKAKEDNPNADETTIAKILGITTTDLRAQKSVALNQREALIVDKIRALKEDGLSGREIGRQLNIPESTVRNYLKATSDRKRASGAKTAEAIKEYMQNHEGVIDVGKGVNLQLQISETRMSEALQILKNEGYTVYNKTVAQSSMNSNRTTVKLLCPPGTTYAEAMKAKVNYIGQDITSEDGGDTFGKKWEYPKSMNSKRLMIRYAEDGGVNKDGNIEIRPGVKDLDLGPGVHYSQVRILVDDTHYLKGMATYGNPADFPDGVDVIFNTNKHKGTPALGDDISGSVLKKIKNDPDNPFGANLREIGGQHHFTDENGNIKMDREHLSLINKRADEGDWNEWSKQVPSQFLSKQPQTLIARQINLSMQQTKDDYESIMRVDNPIVKQSLLDSFQSSCDSQARSLKAAALPQQRYQVILPLTSISDNEIYAPNYADGSTVALIRYPHAGRFEIPIVKVNNRNAEGIQKITPGAQDAVGITAKVASRLSGADFDGDTVMVIPLSNKVRVQNSKPLEGLVDFDTNSYGPDLKNGIKEINGVKHYYRNGIEYPIIKNKQMEMGIVSNLITDMTLKGAPDDELERAVKYSMIVIDAEKHTLDYASAKKELRIDELKNKYQLHTNFKGNTSKGAATLISRASSPIEMPERKDGAYFNKYTNEKLELLEYTKNPRSPLTKYINPETGVIYEKKDVTTKYTDPVTGEKLYHDTKRTYNQYQDKNGKKYTAYLDKATGNYTYVDDKKIRHIVDTDDKRLKKDIVATGKYYTMDIINDANLINSGTIQESYYAKYANYLKKYASQARLDSLNIESYDKDPIAAKKYEPEVKSLQEKLRISLSNAPRERQAEVLANKRYKDKIDDLDEKLDSEHASKLFQKELALARIQTGAKRYEISFSPKEWEAIQAHAIAASNLRQLIKHCDSKQLKELATPREDRNIITTTKSNRIKSMSNAGYTNEEISEAVGLSVSTVIDVMKGDR